MTTRRPSEAKQPKVPPRVWVAVFVLSAVVCTVVGQFITDRGLRGAFVHWEQVDTPPGNPAQLHVGESDQIVLEMTDGRLFEWHQGIESGWSKVTAVSDRSTAWWSVCNSNPNDYYRVARPPKNTVDRVESTCYGPETGVHYEFALSQNGEIWIWQYGLHMFSQIVFRGLALLGGIFLSVVISGIIIVYLYRRKPPTGGPDQA